MYVWLTLTFAGFAQVNIWLLAMSLLPFQFIIRPKHRVPETIFTFQMFMSHLSLTLMCHSLSKGVLLGWPPWWGVLTIVFLETSTPEEAWLVTIILEFAQGFLLTSLTLFLSRVQPCPGLFRKEFLSFYLTMMQLAVVLDTVRRLEMAV